MVLSWVNLGGYEYCLGNKGDTVESNSFLGEGSMAEQEDSRTESTTVNDEREDGNWLQLGIGTSSSTSREIINKQDNTPQTGLVELNLLPETSARDQIRTPVPEFGFRPPTTIVSNTMTPGSGSGLANYARTAPFILQQGVGSSSSFLFPQHQEVNWALRPRNTSSSSFMPGGASQPSFQFQQQLRGVGGVAAGPSFGTRIIDPPRRPHCGIWFLLQASPIQEKAPILPQVPKSYMRIKDGRMTVRLLMKYLVNKLRLDNESEIEIRCRGERLEPYLTLEHVRDSIWNTNSTHHQRHIIMASTTARDHVMVLHYTRS